MYGTHHTRIRPSRRIVIPPTEDGGKPRTIRCDRPSRHTQQRAALAEQGWR